MTRFATVVLSLAIVTGVCWCAEPRDKKPAKTFVVIFDFSCKDKPELGKQLADSLRTKFKDREGFDVVDHLTTAQFSPPQGHDAPVDAIVELMKDKLAVTFALYGTVNQSGGAVTAQVACVDIRKEGKPVTWSKTFTDDSERARGQIAAKVMEEVNRQTEWRPPEYGDETEPKNFGAPLVNGSFEVPEAWQKPDLATSFIEPGESRERGNVLRIQTDLERDKWLEYQRQLRFGQTDPSKAPRLEKNTSYDNSVGALEGVHFCSKPVPAKPGQRYWLVADMKGKTTDFFFPKIFVKGYDDWSQRSDGLPELTLVQLKMTAEQFTALPPARRKEIMDKDAKEHPERYRRESFRWFLSCRNFDDTWKHYAAPFPPRGGLPKNVKWLVVEVYAYWPPAKYLFDNVNMYLDPNQKEPLAEEAARTLNFGKTSDVVEKATSRPAKNK